MSELDELMGNYNKTGIFGKPEDLLKANKEAKAQLAKGKEEELKLAQHVKDTFNTESGKITFQWLLDMTLLRPTWPALDEKRQSISIERVTSYGLMREGQNSIVSSIINMQKLNESNSAQEHAKKLKEKA